MKDLDGKTAVITGGASGIGLALARAFAHEGMKLVIADVEEQALQAATDALRDGGAEAIGVVTDVSKAESVEGLAARTYAEFGACNLLCNNAGVGAPSAKVWETTVNDWRWVHGVNVMGVVHGILAFVPRMIESGEAGHVVNTSSGDGGISPMPAASVYAASKAGVSCITECLAAQLESEATALRASIFYPSGGLLRTGLWTADRNRPAELAREKPRATKAMTVEDLEAMAKKGGHELKFQDLDELAQIVVQGVRDETFVMMIDRESIGDTLRGRAAHLEHGELPAHAGPLG
jgi:NAD(P)-dependent dehydrogenase (short-subunit alcohol dehydrogenase family)